MAEAVKDHSKRGTSRKICFISYFIILEIVAIACLGLSIFVLTFDPVKKLRIWTWFDDTIANLPPLVATGVSALMLITPVIGVVGVIKSNQKIIMVFMIFITMVGFLWLGIGAWGVSLHKLIMGDISIRFDRLKLDGGGVADAQQFLEDLRDNMPRLNNRNNFMCCQGSENSPADALYICAEECGGRYESLFRSIVFPAFYSITFGAGGFCLLSILYACLVSCHLDDVNPAY